MILNCPRPRFGLKSLFFLLPLNRLGRHAPLLGSMGWTEEEMRAYLDWDRAEDARVQARVDERMAEEVNRRGRGLAYLWKMMEEDPDVDQE